MPLYWRDLNFVNIVVLCLAAAHSIGRRRQAHGRSEERPVAQRCHFEHHCQPILTTEGCLLLTRRPHLCRCVLSPWLVVVVAPFRLCQASGVVGSDVLEHTRPQFLRAFTSRVVRRCRAFWLVSTSSSQVGGV